MIDRRTMLGAVAAAAAVVPAMAQTSEKGGRTYVLVHGAWGGGWVWRDVVPGLEAKGHRVFTPTLTGLGDRAHLMSRQISVETHVQDLANTIVFAGLEDVILVGHSYGGVPVTGVADRIPQAIRHVVYLDALILENGESVFDVFPPDLTAAFTKSMMDAGAGVAVPSPDSSVPPSSMRDWATARNRPQPGGSFDTPLKLTRPSGDGYPVTYIAFTAPAIAPVEPSRVRARQKAGWHFEEMAVPHDTPLIYPDRTVERLLQIS